MIDLAVIFGLIALIFLVAALTSGLIERAPISFPMIFLGLGFLLGGHGLGWIQIELDDPILETIATLNLSFVFFLDALNLRFENIRKNWKIPVLSLGPGTLITIGLIALAAGVLLHFSPIEALLIGAVLSSVDPVLLRDVVRDERLPRSIRDSLKAEAGANDMIVLPVLLVLTVIALGEMGNGAGWPAMLARLFLLGPLAGLAVGAAAAYLMKWVRSHTKISREYRAIYGIGVFLAAYATGTWLGSSGFLAVFAAGLATAWLEQDLCDCFLEYGEISSEISMLLAFLLFGGVLSGLIGTVPLAPVLFFTLIVLAIARPVAIGVVLRKAHVSKTARLFIGWFGPRGLSSLLFGLLLVHEAVPGAEKILAVVGIVVMISVVVHGVSAAPLVARYQRAILKETLPEEREATVAGLYDSYPAEAPRITVQELADRLESHHPPVLLDVRSRSGFELDEGQIPGSIRVVPDQVTEWAEGQSKDIEYITYCT